MPSWLYEGVERQKAEELLSLPGNRVGSFMIRESAKERGEDSRVPERVCYFGLTSDLK